MNELNGLKSLTIKIDMQQDRLTVWFLRFAAGMVLACGFKFLLPDTSAEAAAFCGFTFPIFAWALETVEARFQEWMEGDDE